MLLRNELWLLVRSSQLQKDAAYDILIFLQCKYAFFSLIYSSLEVTEDLYFDNSLFEESFLSMAEAQIVGCIKCIVLGLCSDH